jgi:glucose-1-phosphate thymidylyltransferase
MKGIILAGGSGTRLDPLTKVICKQLLPVYNKPMIFYPLSSLMLAGIREILIITNPTDLENFQRLLGNGSSWGLQIQYEIQKQPNGVAEAFIIGQEFLAGDSCALVLGDNLFYKDGLQQMLASARMEVENSGGAVVFAHHVADPKRYGVIEIEISKNNGPDRVLSIEEKPQSPKSNYAVIGFYFYDSSVVRVAKEIRPSIRGELEISDVNQYFLRNGKLKCVRLGRGAAWLDMGTPDSLLDAAQFVATIERRQGLRIADLDEIAEHMNFT